MPLDVVNLNNAFPRHELSEYLTHRNGFDMASRCPMNCQNRPFLLLYDLRRR